MKFACIKNEKKNQIQYNAILTLNVIASVSAFEPKFVNISITSICDKFSTFLPLIAIRIALSLILIILLRIITLWTGKIIVFSR